MLLCCCRNWLQHQDLIANVCLTVGTRLPEVVYSFTLENGGDAEWRPKSFDMVEGIFDLYELSVQLTTLDLDAELDDLLGAPAELMIERGEFPRYMTGIVRQVEFISVDHDRLNVVVHIVPALWGLTQRNDSRHWQNMSVPDILEEVLASSLGDYSREVRLDLNGSYEPREFCAQYRETDYDFVRRLMSEEGIYFYFDFTGGQTEVLVLADVNDSLPEVILGQDGAMVALCPENQLDVSDETVQTFHWKRQLTSTAVVQRDFDWQSPDAPPNDELREPDLRGFEREIYEPGERRYGAADAAALAESKLQSLVAKGTIGSGVGNVTGFTPGAHFGLQDHHLPDVATEHILMRVTHHGTWQDAEVTQRATGTTYTNSFETIPFDVPYRAPRTAPRPLVHGPQTAVVTGAGEINVDEAGRVQVSLTWDRVTGTSCWVRVAQLSAGAGFGAMFIPRVGMEVVVEFLDGNPDRPIITGCVYNGANPPPYGLPGDKTKSTIKTNSSPGGGGFNEVRFEDAAGSEELYFHAQKDMTIQTLNDKNQSTGNDETLAIANDRTKSVGNNQVESIGVDKTIDVGSNHTESIGANRGVTVGANDTLSVGGAQSISVGSSLTENVGVAKTSTMGAAYAINVGAGMLTNVGGALAEAIGAARSVNVGGVSSETIGLTKSVKAKDIKHSASKTITTKADTDMVMESVKKMTVKSGDDMEISGAKKAKIEIKDEFTLKCGKASITLKKNGDIIIKGNKISVKGKSDIKLKGSKVLNN